MEGLEIKEIKVKTILDSSILRLESEYFTAKSFTLKKSFTGAQIIDFVQYGTSEELNEEGEGFPVLRLNEFDGCFIGQPSKNTNKIDAATYDILKLRTHDVLICRTNGNPKYVGKSAIVMKNYDYAFASYLFRIRPITNIINPFTLVAYLNSKYGRLEIEKYSMQGNQSNFSPAKFREIRIPAFRESLQDKIESNFNLSFEKHELSKQKYEGANKLLFNKLGLNDFKVSKKIYNVKYLKESFVKSNRLDAEYYQPKYDDYLNLIKNNIEGSSNLHSICNVKDSNFSPKVDIEYKYVELSNIGLQGEITGATVDMGSALPSRARRLIKEGDVIISSIEGSLQSCALVPAEYDNALCSTGFYVINSKEINSETLLLLFKSELMQNILKQNCSGTILTAINKNEFLNIQIPIIDPITQREISKLVQESFRVKNESERLLQVAKQAVEIAIEQDEDKAMEFINQYLKN